MFIYHRVTWHICNGHVELPHILYPNDWQPQADPPNVDRPQSELPYGDHPHSERPHGKEVPIVDHPNGDESGVETVVALYSLECGLIDSWKTSVVEEMRRQYLASCSPHCAE
jgi:hypothetical protein